MAEDKTNFDEIEQPNAPGISLQEVQAVVTIIDLCTKRGAFEGSELSSVGQIREAFAKVINFHAQATQVVTDDANDTGA